MALKDGSIVECKIVNLALVKANKQFVQVKIESGEIKEIPVEQVAGVYYGKTSWEKRADNQKWYEGQKPKIKDRWQDHFRMARECKRRELENEFQAHAKRAYELRAAEIKDPDDIDARGNLARWLERDLKLLPEAQEEYRKILAVKREKAGDKPGDHMKLGDWCFMRGLYDEAKAEYEEVLKLDPKNNTAKGKIKKIEGMTEVALNTPIYRAVKDELLRAVAYIRGKQAADGSFGRDIHEAGIQAHRAMSALCGWALLIGEEIRTAENPSAFKIPNELPRCLDFVIGSPEERKAQRGPDVWGNIWSVGFLAACLRKDQFKGYADRIKAKIASIYGALARQMGPPGGWSYYDFAVNRSNSFVTAVAIIFMNDAKKVGIPLPQYYDRAVDCVLKQKQKVGVFMYATGTPQTVEGSQGRASACEIALNMAGKSNRGDLLAAVNYFFQYRHILEKMKGVAPRGTPHMGEGGTAPYYYLYGHLWTSRAIRFLEKSQITPYATKMADVFLPSQDADGTFHDFPFVSQGDAYKVYGSAMGALALYYLCTFERDDAKLNPR